MWQKIELLIDAKKLNWAELARLIGVQDSRISKWRSGTGEVDRNQLLRIAKVLETSTDYLADDSLDEPRVTHYLADDERAVLQVYRALRPQIDEARAIRALSAASNAGIADEQRRPIVGHPVDPETGEATETSETRTSKRRRQA